MENYNMGVTWKDLAIYKKQRDGPLFDTNKRKHR